MSTSAGASAHTLDLVINPLPLIVVSSRVDVPAPAPAVLALEVSLIAAPIRIFGAPMPEQQDAPLSLSKVAWRILLCQGRQCGCPSCQCGDLCNSSTQVRHTEK